MLYFCVRCWGFAIKGVCVCLTLDHLWCFYLKISLCVLRLRVLGTCCVHVCCVGMGGLVVNQGIYEMEILYLYWWIKMKCMGLGIVTCRCLSGKLWYLQQLCWRSHSLPLNQRCSLTWKRCYFVMAPYRAAYHYTIRSSIDTTRYRSRVSKWHTPNDTLNRYLHPVFERKVTII